MLLLLLLRRLLLVVHRHRSLGCKTLSLLLLLEVYRFNSASTRRCKTLSLLIVLRLCRYNGSRCMPCWSLCKPRQGGNENKHSTDVESSFPIHESV
jgi:hypothetical protein